MIYTPILMGGLGNRLFQIASIYGLSKNHGATFVLDEIRPNPHQKVIYEQIYDSFDKRTSDWNVLSFPEGIAHKYIDISPQQKDTKFVGYFQSEKYFEHVQEDIRKLFACPNEIRNKILERYPEVDNGFFIHVRRNDYLVGNCKKVHYIDLEYYYKQVLSKIDPDTHVFILSDDMDWCQEQSIFTDLKNVKFVMEDEVTSLYLMTMCERGGATANSSFSWWGAWLNDSPNKKIYMPGKWFALPEFNTADIYPKGSIIIEESIWDPIDLIFYINLDHRTDRKLEMEEQFRKVNAPVEKIKRMSAIYNQKSPQAGCTSSHIKCLQYAKDNGYKNVLILEDDFNFNENYNNLSEIRNMPEWDVIHLSGNLVILSDHSKTLPPCIKRATRILSGSAYIVNSGFIDTLIETFQDSVEALMTNRPNPLRSQYVCPNAPDIKWIPLQEKHNWFIFQPKLGLQRESYSDIEKRIVNYRC